MASNTATALPWEKLRDDRGISGFGKREAPVDFECAADPFHNWREWIEVPA